MLNTAIAVLSLLGPYGSVSSARGALPASSLHASVLDSVPVNDSNILLTNDLMRRMTKFWQHFQKEPDSIRVAGQAAHVETFPLFGLNSDQTGSHWIRKNVINIGAMAAQYPSVKNDLAQSGLTVDQWNDVRHALYKATVVGGMSFTKEVEANDTSHVGKNIVFLASRTEEVDALRTAGMWIPDPEEVEDAVKQFMTKIMSGQAANDITLP